MNTETGLLGQLGINWKLFLSQLFNFAILLVILRTFLYKPLLKTIKERNRKIEEGLEKAEAADIRLKEVDQIAVQRLKKAELQSIDMVKATEEKAKRLEQDLKQKAEAHQQELMEKARENYEKQLQASKTEVMKEASALVKTFIMKTVELKPEAVDEALIKKTVAKMKEEAW